MTTQELHVNIDLLLQEVSSNWSNNFLPQEKDIFINKEILKFIKQRLSPLSNEKRQGAYDIIKRILDVNSLVKTIEVPVLQLNEKEAVIQLPFNHLYYISAEASVCCNCQTVETVEKIKYFTYLPPIEDSGLVDISDILIILEVGDDTITLVDTTTLPEEYFPTDNVSVYKKAFIYNNLIISLIERNLPIGFEVTYDKVNNKIVIASYTNSTTTFSIGETDITVEEVQETYNVYELANTLDAEVRIVDEEFKTSIKHSNLSGNKDNSRIAYLRDKVVIFPITDTVILSTVNLTYLCNPKKVDVLLNHNTDISDSALEEVIDNVARTLKGIISDDGYEKFIRENSLVE
jgi:hypothetical protein